jgi:hypothetical protein
MTAAEDDPLASAAALVRQGIAQRNRGREDFIAGVLAMAAGLAQARERFPSNQAFGAWCAANGFDEGVINKDERAALIDFGGDLTRARAVLERTERWPIQLIHAYDWKPKPSSEAPKTEPPGTVPPWPTSGEQIRFTMKVGPAPDPFVHPAAVREAIKAAQADIARERREQAERAATEPANENSAAPKPDSVAEIARLKAKYREDVAALIRAHAEEIRALKAAHAEEVGRLKGEIARLKAVYESGEIGKIAEAIRNAPRGKRGRGKESAS